MKAILTNVPIRDLLAVLNKLASQFEMVDVVIYPDEKKIIIEPVENTSGDSELSDDNIYTLI